MAIFMNGSVSFGAQRHGHLGRRAEIGCAGDENVGAGFWIHETDDAGKFSSHFIDTPARKYHTITLKNDDIAGFVNGNLVFANDIGKIKDAIVRVVYACDDALNKQLNRRALEQSLYDAGAFFVSEIRGDIARADRQRDAELTEQLGPIDAVRKWCVNQEMPAEDVEELAAMTARLMEVA